MPNIHSFNPLIQKKKKLLVTLCESNECDCNNEFDCNGNGNCIGLEFVNDGEQDCSDGSDEGVIGMKIVSNI